MSEQSEIYRDLKVIQQAERAARRIRAVELLKEHAVIYTNPNNGAHLIAWVRGSTIDIYPGPDWWRVRGEKKRWRGIDSFIERATKVKP